MYLHLFPDTGCPDLYLADFCENLLDLGKGNQAAEPHHLVTQRLTIPPGIDLPTVIQGENDPFGSGRNSSRPVPRE